MLQFFENLVAQPLYFELHKGGIFAKGLRSGKTFEGELYVWKYNDPDKGDIIVSIGNDFNSKYPNPNKIPENQTSKQKVFYNKEDLIVGDFENAHTALNHVIKAYLNNKASFLVRPALIFNVPNDLSPVELRVLQDMDFGLGGRGCFIISEPKRPMDHQLKNPDKMTFNTLRRPETYISDRNIAIIIFFSLVVAIIFIVANIKFLW